MVIYTMIHKKKQESDRSRRIFTACVEKVAVCNFFDRIMLPCFPRTSKEDLSMLRKEMDL